MVVGYGGGANQVADVKTELFNRGVERVTKFCQVNSLLLPSIESVPSERWRVGACAYYRKDTIKICLAECAFPCTQNQVRNWNWPGSSVDREPYGVLCHELGHHVDLYSGIQGWAYSSEFSETMMKASGEKKLTNYCPNPAEWFAEMFRLYVTNHALLQLIRPKTWKLLRERWKPVSHKNWIIELGADCPKRIIESNLKKGLG